MAAAAGATTGIVAREIAEQKAAYEELGFAQYVSRILFRWGTVFVIGGFAMGTAGYFLKATATAAANNDTAILSNIQGIFSNIRAPAFSAAPAGTAPLSASVQGVQNFFSDAWTNIRAAGSDIAQTGAVIGTLAEDAGIAITDVAKSFLVFTMHFPSL